MANTTKSSATKKSATKKTTTKPAAAKAPAKEVKSTPLPEEKIAFTPKGIDPEDYVVVKNGFQGTLVYESPKTGEVFIWGEFGDEQEMTLRELKGAKNSSKGHFTNNWFMFDEEFQWVPAYLGVEKYYANSINIDEFDEVLTSPVDVLESRIKAVPKGQRTSLAYRARQLVLDGVIDSIKSIKALESILSIELIEK